jgi:SAM-dependent methyltransferase
MLKNLITNQTLDLAALGTAVARPALFEPGEPQFWTDPHIARQMLATHLDPNVEAASRPPQVIDATVAWLAAQMDLKPGDSLLDLGCGPGLYTKRFADRGLKVTGVDYSQNSLAYARQQDPASAYLHQDYRMLDVAGPFDAVTLIFGDLCVLNDDDRDTVLRHVYNALKPGGWFAFDVSTPNHHPHPYEGRTWYVTEGAGFWKPGPHLVLEERFGYPEHDTALDQYTVIEDNGTVTVYRNWFHDYTLDTITPILTRAGFDIVGAYSDLLGTPRTANSWWLGVISRRTQATGGH